LGNEKPLRWPSTQSLIIQAKLPIDNILGCRAALIQTTLVYSDKHKRLKVLVPIREYMQKIQPPGNHLVQPLLKHFQGLLEVYIEYHGTQSSAGTVARISSNYSNILNLLQHQLLPGHPDLVNSIYFTCHLNQCSRLMGHGTIPLIGQIHNILPSPCDHHLEAYFTTELFYSQQYVSISNPDVLVSNTLEHFKWFDDPDLRCMYIY
jgi:hypothetical protein